MRGMGDGARAHQPREHGGRVGGALSDAQCSAFVAELPSAHIAPARIRGRAHGWAPHSPYTQWPKVPSSHQWLWTNLRLLNDPPSRLMQTEHHKAHTRVGILKHVFGPKAPLRRYPCALHFKTFEAL